MKNTKHIKKIIKHKYFKSLTLVVGLVASSHVSYAQVSLTGEIRPRTEYRHGFKSMADSAQKSAIFTSQRSRLNFGYQSEGYLVKIVLQDVRVWGNQSQLVNNQDFGASIHEAWGEALINKQFSVKFGRQEIAYDDQRILGSVGWAQQARSHDALLFKFKVDSTFNIHLGGAFNQDKEQLTTTLYTIPGNYKAIQYLWAHKDFGKTFGASFLFLNNGKQAVKTDSTGTIFKDNYGQTAGTFLKYKKNKLSVSANFYYQFGKDVDNTNYWGNPDIEAMLFGGEVTYNISEKFTATAGYEYQSGQSQTDTTLAYREIKHAFTPLYGTNHKFNGTMDYFYVGNHIGSVGLQDIYFKVKYKSEKSFWIGAAAHLFSATADVLDQNELLKTGNITAMNSSLGTELDLNMGWKLSKGVDFKMGYSQMIGTETLAILNGVTTFDNGDLVGRTDQLNNWAWMMITIKPDFLKK